MSDETWSKTGKDGKTYCFERKNGKTKRVSCKQEPQVKKTTKKKPSASAKQQKKKPATAASKKKKATNQFPKLKAKDPKDAGKLADKLKVLQDMLSNVNDDDGYTEEEGEEVIPDVTSKTTPMRGVDYSKKEWKIMAYEHWDGDSYFQRYPNLFDEKSNMYTGPIRDKNHDIFIPYDLEVEEINEEFKYVVSWHVMAKSKKALEDWLKTITPAGNDHEHRMNKAR